MTGRSPTYLAVLATKLRKLGRPLAIQGELLGPGIQGNKYQLARHRLFVFNCFDFDQSAYVDKSECDELCQILELEQVPVIGEQQVPESLDEILACAEGGSVLHPQTEREGLVWVHGSGANRISFKTISNRFLTKNE